MSVRALLFPEKSRAFPGQRWANILLRSLHLVGVTGVGAGVLIGIPAADWQVYYLLTLCSGFLLVAIALWSSAIWLCQVRGAAVLLKLLLLVLLGVVPELSAMLLLTVVMLSGIVSHAPGELRYYSLCHRRGMDSRKHHGSGRQRPSAVG